MLRAIRTRASIGLLAAVLIAGLLGCSNDFPTISAAEASHHVGEKAAVCGQVVSATYAATSRGQPTFLNLDSPYPRQIFTIVVWGEDRAKFSSPPELLYDGRRVCVTGVIKVYRGTPEIIVRSPRQIELQ